MGEEVKCRCCTTVLRVGEQKGPGRRREFCDVSCKLAMRRALDKFKNHDPMREIMKLKGWPGLNRILSENGVDLATENLDDRETRDKIIKQLYL